MEEVLTPESPEINTPSDQSDDKSGEKAYNELLQEYTKKKKKFVSNLIELAVGGLLLVVCINYLRMHPAEKTSIFSGLEVIVQRVEIIVSNVFHRKGEDLKEKYDLEKSYQELITLIEEGKCGTLEDVKQVTEKQTFLRNLTLEEFGQQKAALISFARIMYTKIKDNCDEKIGTGVMK